LVGDYQLLGYPFPGYIPINLRIGFKQGGFYPIISNSILNILLKLILIGAFYLILTWSFLKKLI